jgi:hypothetical protein
MTRDDDTAEQYFLAYYFVYYVGPKLTHSEREMLCACHIAQLFKRNPDSREGYLDKADCSSELIDSITNTGLVEATRKITTEVLERYGDKIVVNRCPRCSRLAKTPKAKQCPWCFHSWRDD